MYSIFIGYLQDNINNILHQIGKKQEPCITFGILKNSQRLKKLNRKSLQLTCTDNIRQTY